MNYDFLVYTLRAYLLCYKEIEVYENFMVFYTKFVFNFGLPRVYFSSNGVCLHWAEM